MEKIFKQLKIQRIQTDHHIISPIELKDYIDFDVKRIYYTTDITGSSGAHCHKIEKELFIMIKGTATAVIDQGNGLEEIPLMGPTSALYIGNYVWHHFKDFSPDAVMLALSSTNYSPDRSDYIEDYEKYKKMAYAK